MAILWVCRTRLAPQPPVLTCTHLLDSLHASVSSIVFVWEHMCCVLCVQVAVGVSRCHGQLNDATASCAHMHTITTCAACLCVYSFVCVGSHVLSLHACVYNLMIFNLFHMCCVLCTRDCWYQPGVKDSCLVPQLLVHTCTHTPNKCLPALHMLYHYWLFASTTGHATVKLCCVEVVLGCEHWPTVVHTMCSWLAEPAQSLSSLAGQHQGQPQHRVVVVAQLEYFFPIDCPTITLCLLGCCIDLCC